MLVGLTSAGGGFPVLTGIPSAGGDTQYWRGYPVLVRLTSAGGVFPVLTGIPSVDGDTQCWWDFSSAGEVFSMVRSLASLSSRCGLLAGCGLNGGALNRYISL